MKIIREYKGITLIALVITIIVLLILAGISISMLSGNNGLLSKAEQAKSDNIEGQEKEQVKLAYSTAKIKNLGGNVIEQNLQDELDVLVGENKTQVTAGVNVIKVKFIDTNHFYKIENNEVSEVSGNTVNSLQIGDFVNYTYDSAEDININAYSGTTIEEGVVSDTAQTVTQTKNLKWKIFNIDETKETIDLISENPTSSKLLIRSTPRIYKWG